MEKYDNFISNWLSTIHVVIVILFSALFIVAFHLGNPIVIYAVAIMNSGVWIWNLFKVKSLIKDILQDKKRWQLAATYDALTGVLNRGIFIQGLVKEIQRAQRYDEKMSFIIFDLDKFKDVNDTHGHSVGDEILIAVSDKIKNMIRSMDAIGRLGGEEFGIMLPETDIVKAKATAERIRRAVESVRVRDNIGVTISLGVTELNSKDNIDTIYERADKALYQSKDSGRNKTTVI